MNFEGRSVTNLKRGVCRSEREDRIELEGQSMKFELGLSVKIKSSLKVGA